jgi:outer membrane protein assembly factor BamD
MRFVKFLIVIIAAVTFLSACNGEFNKVLKSKDYEYKLKMADKYFEEKKYRNAQQLYLSLIHI